MKNLFKRRLFSHLTEMTKYLKYVFNDFFVLALIFLIGGLGFEYSNVLKQLHTGIWWTNIVTLIVLFISIQLGNLATLVKSPDYIFLAPRDKDMKSYFKSGYFYSLINANIIQFIVWIIILPFIKISNNYNWLTLFIYLALMILIKINWMKNDYNKIHHIKQSFLNKSFLNKIIFPLIILIVTIWGSPLIGLILTIIWLGYQIYQYKIYKNTSINWKYIITMENNRMHNVYRIFNLFVDIPEVNSTIKRRYYLNSFLDRFNWSHRNGYLYLYLHGVIRDRELSGLYLRLTIIGALLLFFIQNSILIIIFGVLFIYLISFQVIPFYSHFNENVFTHIYPLDNKIKNFKKIVMNLLIFTDIIFLLVTFANTLSVQLFIIMLILMILETYLIVYVYIPHRIKK